MLTEDSFPTMSTGGVTMTNNSDLAYVPLFTEQQQRSPDKGLVLDKLIGESRTTPGQSGTERISEQKKGPGESLQPPFKPTSVDIDEFLKNEWILSGLSREDLRAISVKAATVGDTRKQHLSDFLETHFDDVSSLSDGGNRISSSDLKLYGQLLRSNESSANPNEPNLARWKPLHYEHEMNNSFMPAAGAIAGISAASKALDVVAKIPQIATNLVPLKATNPRAYFGTIIAASITTHAAAMFGGAKIGDVISRSVNSGDVNRHFYDEAAPAMKRLMGR